MDFYEDQYNNDAKRRVETPQTGLSKQAKAAIAVVILVAVVALCLAVVGSAGIGYLGAAAYTFFFGG